VQYYLPQGGTWTHVLSGETKQPGWHKENYGFDSLPLFARPNSIIAFGANDQRPDYDYSNGVDFNVYALEDGRTATAAVRDIKGVVETTVSVAREGKSIVVSLQGTGKAFSVTLNSIGEIASASGASASVDGNTVIVPAGENNVTVTITLA
jgi:Alpha-glucosidases, family 31 of glycosyl hydrolases